MRILFCNIAWMLYYKGIGPGEVEPSSGGEYVKKTGDAHEKHNFLPTDLTFKDGSMPDGRYCLGFVETKATGKERVNQLHIERIGGCAACGSEPAVDDVLVVYCATHPAHNSPRWWGGISTLPCSATIRQPSSMMTSRTITPLPGSRTVCYCLRQCGADAACGTYPDVTAVRLMDLDAPMSGLQQVMRRTRNS